MLLNLSTQVLHQFHLKSRSHNKSDLVKNSENSHYIINCSTIKTLDKMNVFKVNNNKDRMKSADVVTAH